MITRSAQKEAFENGTLKRQWWVVDAKGQTLGRLATKVAMVLRGKHKPIFTPHVDTGDFVIVVNAAHIAVTGNKMKDKMYYHHTGWPGGLKSANAAELLRKKPTMMVEKAVKGMMPKNALNRKALLKLKVFAEAEHSHQAQQPKPLSI